MKNLLTHKNVIFMSNTSVAILVFNKVANKLNVLFADQVPANAENIQSNLSNLLAKAANFLGYNIKEASLVFEDYDIKSETIEESYANCLNKREVINEVRTKAVSHKKFVDSLTINEGDLKIEYGNAQVKCNLLYSDYNKYLNFYKCLNDRNIKITESVNKAVYLSNNDKMILILHIKVDNSYACEYVDNKLVKSTKLNIDFNKIINVLSQHFDFSIDEIRNMVKKANILISNPQQSFSLGWDYDLANKKLSKVDSAEFISIWQNELKKQIEQQINLNEFENYKIISDDKINIFNNVLLNNSIIGLDQLSYDNIMFINNINKLITISSEANYDKDLINDIVIDIKSIIA